LTSCRHSTPRNRGFSLVELLAVVTITAILAVAGVAMFRHHVTASRAAEATSVIQAIRSAEESFLAENHVYLNVSTAGGGSAWYPRATPNTDHASWVNSSHADWPRWQQLGAPVKQSVIFSYLANAGVPNVALPALQVASSPVFAAPVLNWYVIQAKGDTDNNGKFTLYASTSMTGEMYIENEGE
jgi:prepilin-type N-terminal cleavage/methylation domain-containing protein